MHRWPRRHVQTKGQTCQTLHPTCDAFALMEPSGHVPTPRCTPRSVTDLRLCTHSGCRTHGQGPSGAEKPACGCRHGEETQTGHGESTADHAWLRWSGQEMDDVGTSSKVSRTREDRATSYQVDTLRGVDVGTTGASAATAASNGSNRRDVRTSSQNYRRRRKSIVVKGVKGKPSQTVPRLCGAGSRSGGPRVRMKEGHRSSRPPKPRQ